MADDPNNVPDEVKTWVRHPVPPEMIAAYRAECSDAEFAAEVEAMLRGRVKMYTFVEVLAELDLAVAAASAGTNEAVGDEWPVYMVDAAGRG